MEDNGGALGTIAGSGVAVVTDTARMEEWDINIVVMTCRGVASAQYDTETFLGGEKNMKRIKKTVG
jgi:hypothetical protein